MDLSALEQAFEVSYPASFRDEVCDFIELMKGASFMASFPDTHILLTIPEIKAAQEISEESLLPFMLSEGEFPDIYAFDLASQGPDYEVLVWCGRSAVHQWRGFSEFRAWVEAR